jgi:hypothetical protein
MVSTSQSVCAASSGQYQSRPVPVTSYCHCSRSQSPTRRDESWSPSRCWRRSTRRGSARSRSQHVLSGPGALAQSCSQPSAASPVRSEAPTRHRTPAARSAALGAGIERRAELGGELDATVLAEKARPGQGTGHDLADLARGNVGEEVAKETAEATGTYELVLEEVSSGHDEVRGAAAVNAESALAVDGFRHPLRLADRSMKVNCSVVGPKRSYSMSDEQLTSMQGGRPTAGLATCLFRTANRRPPCVS